MRSVLRTLPLLALALGLAVLALARPLGARQDSPAVAPKAGESLTSAEALAAFDQAWQTVHDSHFDQGFNGVDWDAVKRELRPRAEKARTQAELRAVIGEMLERLGQSHFVVIPSDALPEEGGGSHDQSGGLGFDVRLRGEVCLVVSVEAGSSAQEAGVAPGWIVERVGSLDVAAIVERMSAAGVPARKASFSVWGSAQSQLLGPVGGRVRVELRDGQDRPVTLELERRKRDVTAHEIGPTLPTFYLAFHADVLERGGKKIGVIGFSNWFLPVMQPFDAAVDRMRACDGIVIDLRGNTGGVAAMTMGIAGHFFAETTRLGVMITRDSVLNILALPRRVNAAGELVEPFGGPLALVVDETTGSASEVFAGGLQSTGRARIFGETTAGAVLPALPTRLPNGDTLLHALGDFETSTGARLEGVGVVPDQVVPLERQELLAGRDAPLEAALAWIQAGGR